MFKKQFITIAIALALTLAATGVSTVIADSLGWAITPTAQACNGQGSGGGC